MAEQPSPAVVFPSSQCSPHAACRLPSPHSVEAPWQTLLAQVSLTVHTLPSLHGAVFGVWSHVPEGATQLSSVHPLSSSQLGAGPPPTQAPPPHVSTVVQPLPSSHEAVLFTFAQPSGGLHPSLVHTLLSLQLGGEPPAQPPWLHASPVVQASALLAT
jgi:hypothetical protein